ncbi:hypothetical protein SAMN05444003_2342 [Cognatiyoonia sediminum]|uniref:Sulfotransferase family protein n=1 Tax=Cognatiyoonia sediminum TaxID=1508389 RepID=A0A1M5QWV5_9RHOB|nr:hypothetical protein [Cognatiyoonia sediminum]SHH18043.1 hypothetical protein SAMN05444003_2342 [Cognatiyoonia sediminum]
MGTTAILHIGSRKAGSTTLQNDLFSWRHALKDEGILIPEFEGRRINEDATRAFFDENTNDPKLEKVFSKVFRDIEKTQPKYVFLSSEYLYENAYLAANVKRLLSEVCNEIRPVLMLREPAGYYLSWVQQWLKATDRLDDPATWAANYRKNISVWRSVFGDQLVIVPFEARSFPKGLSECFLENFFEVDLGKVELAERKSSNVSEFREVTFLMQEYFRHCYPDQPREFRRETRLIKKTLQEVAEAEGLGSRADLLPKVQEIVLSNHRDDLFWLREVEGIEFSALDYSQLKALGSTSLTQVGRYQRFQDIVGIDETRANLILMKGMQQMSKRISHLVSTKKRLTDKVSRLSGEQSREYLNG